ncbi:MAG: hypothetical protein AB1531_03425 [Chloroflexota bacterium]
MKTRTFLICLTLLLPACTSANIPLPADEVQDGGSITEAQPSPPAAASTTSEPDLTVTIGAPTGESIRPLLGINAGPVPIEADGADLTAAYQEIGVTLIRTHDFCGPLDMATMYPDQNADPYNPASYDFSASDQVFAAILGGGFEPYLRLGDSYGSANGFPPARPRAPVNPEHWVLAAVEVVRHYHELAEEAGIPLRYVEIWNEPDLSQFWDGSQQEFFSLFDQTAHALKNEFPTLLIGGPGLTQASALATPESHPGRLTSGQGQEYTRAFLDYLQSRQTPIDFFSWHMYSNNPKDFVKAAQFYRTELDTRGFTQVPLHNTEWNTALNTDNQAATEEFGLGGHGAAILTASWIAMQQEGIAEVTLYRGSSPSNRIGLGIFFADGQPKRAALVFSLWAELVQHPQWLRLTLDGDDPGLWLLAGQAETGEIAILIANPTEQSVVVQMILPDGRIAQPAAMKTVSDANDGIEESVPDVLIDIPAYSVQLIEINP